MQSTTNILIAFLLNLFFSIFEFIGGLFTNSIAIITDSIHDLTDALSILLSYIFERKSKQKPNNRYTYGYIRYSVLGALITTIILLSGSLIVIYSALKRFINPVTIKYDGMIIMSIIGIIVNGIATFTTSRGDSLNEKTVSLHMLEDVLGWIVVLVGAILIKFTHIYYIDAILTILVASFIFFHAFKNFKNILDLFLEKIPRNLDIAKIKKELLKNKDIKDIHHIHIWSLDGTSYYATMHVVTKNDAVKKYVKDYLKKYNISHTTIELEKNDYECEDKECIINVMSHHHHH